MTNQLNQVEEILSGERRYKFLDPTRKAVLALPNAAFKLWMAYWVHEQDTQEAYPTMDTLVRVTGMTEGTIRTARRYLLEAGWLIRLTGSAAEHYLKPTNGSWNIEVYRVDDPTTSEMTPQNLMGQKMTLPKVAPNGCSCCCCYPCTCIGVKVEIETGLKLKLKPEGSGDSFLPSLRSDESPEEHPEEQKKQQQQKQQQRQKPMRISSAAK